MTYILNSMKKMLAFVPDKIYLQMYYFTKFHKFIDFRNPQTFNEKLQWLKINDRKPLYTKMVDKYEAKNYVGNIIGHEYIIPTYGIWDCFEDINFDLLPEQFVLKCTHDCGGLVVCRDKKSLDLIQTKEKIEKYLKTDYYAICREWPYKNVKPRILAEKYMEQTKCGNVSGRDINCGLTDYKFYCINGEPKFIFVSQGMENHSTARMSFLTMDWRLAPFGRSDYKPLVEFPKKPTRFAEMKKLAQILSEGHSFLRVDFYDINNQIYFGELTFYPCGGMMKFEPEEWDKRIGDMLVLP